MGKGLTFNHGISPYSRQSRGIFICVIRLSGTVVDLIECDVCRPIQHIYGDSRLSR